MPFLRKLRDAQEAVGSILCVGLDPDPVRMPIHLANLPAADAVAAFCTEIIGATSDIACAYKPNLAFFEAMGPAGLGALDAVVETIGSDRIIIADAKRGDIGSTARHYAKAFYERMGSDALTVSPYMGADSLEPFLSHADKAAFALVLTSNEGAGDVQLLDAGGRAVYEHVAELAVRCGHSLPGTVGFVVGGTHHERLAALREAYPDVPFLVPGVGAQGAPPRTVMEATRGGPTVVNASRSVIYASNGRDFAAAARSAAEDLAALLS